MQVPISTPTTRLRAMALCAILAVGGIACGSDDDTDPTELPAGDFDESTVIGLDVDEAERVAADAGWVLRVARLDGEDLALTMDFRTDRVNVAVEDDIVTEVLSIG